MNIAELSGAPQGRRYPAGAEIVTGGTSFRVWAPDRQSVEVIIGGKAHRLHREHDGYHAAVIADVGAGARYHLRLDEADKAYPDPASRYQPEGPAGPSQVVDAESYPWRDDDWKGVVRQGQVLYELHVGTFSAEGTWKGAIPHLEKLSRVGVTVLEIMPVAEFVGTFGWGYDGMLLYAPTHLYGTPDDFRAFVEAAHRLGLGVVFDVVYNHFGVGDQFEAFSERYFSGGPANEWGRAINFDAGRGKGAREYFVANALYWLAEFHVDGFRFDATQAIHDDSPEYVLSEIVRKCRAAAPRPIMLIGENEPQRSMFIASRETGGVGLDAMWNDDFHHAVSVAATGRRQAYRHDYFGTPQELVSAAKHGYLYQGQYSEWQNQARGEPVLDFGPDRFITFLQNHDQIANSTSGTRLWQQTSPALARALTAFWLLSPQTPLLFQGQEFAASAPFRFFLDTEEGQRDGVAEGRLDFLSQFPSLRDPAARAAQPRPDSRDVFASCKLDWSEFETHGHVVALHRDLLRIRREHAAMRRQPRAGAGEMDGAVISAEALAIRYFADEASDQRLLVLNMGSDLAMSSVAEPLMAPPRGMEWQVIWSSEDIAYGGDGRRPVDMSGRWVLDGKTALLFAPVTARPSAPFDKEALRRWQYDKS